MDGAGRTEKNEVSVETTDNRAGGVDAGEETAGAEEIAFAKLSEKLSMHEVTLEERCAFFRSSAREPEGDGLLPSDFTFAGLYAAQVEDLMNRVITTRKSLESCFSLRSPAIPVVATEARGTGLTPESVLINTETATAPEVPSPADTDPLTSIMQNFKVPIMSLYSSTPPPPSSLAYE